jgi:RNA polymerase sigma factor (sigma-70 family)
MIKGKNRLLESAAKDVEQNTTLDTAIQADRKRLFDFIRRRVRTSEDAEDILQDVFYQLVTSYSVTEPIERLTSWLFTVAKNKVIDWYRKRRPQSLPFDEENEGPLNLENILFDPTQNPDEVYARSLVWTELTDALDELPEEQRQVFVMHELEGKNFKEIAEITGESINTLLSRKRYAVLFLREQLKELYDELQNL